MTIINPRHTKPQYQLKLAYSQVQVIQSPNLLRFVKCITRQFHSTNDHHVLIHLLQLVLRSLHLQAQRIHQIRLERLWREINRESFIAFFWDFVDFRVTCSGIGRDTPNKVLRLRSNWFGGVTERGRRRGRRTLRERSLREDIVS